MNKVLLISFDELDDYLNEDISCDYDNLLDEFICFFNVEHALSEGHGIWIDADEEVYLFEENEYIAITEDGSKWQKATEITSLFNID